MQESKRNELLKSDLKERLDWYTLYASEEEYDEKAVESILYLLDTWEPLEEGIVPPKTESWQRFLEMADRGQELLPVEESIFSGRAEDCTGTKASGSPEGRKPDQMPGKSGDMQTGRIAADAEKDLAGGREEDGIRSSVKERAAEFTESTERTADENRDSESGSAGRDMPDHVAERPVKTPGRCSKFAARHKILVAAVLLLLILVVGNTVQTIARQNEGFFFWLNRDDSGIQMMTSPEGLDSSAEKTQNVYYDKEDMPAWAQDWLAIETEIEMPEEYEWQYYEASELDNRRHVASHYLLESSAQEIVFGVWMYVDKISYYKEKFTDYNFVERSKISQKEIGVYDKVEEDGKIYYVICFYEGNSQNYLQGWDNLDELKMLVEIYWKNVEKNN